MTSHHASGSFTVSMQPQPCPESAPGATLGRMLLDKHYQGDLQATAQGQMLSAMTATAGSAGYVAIEQVSGTLQGRSGSFVLQHSGLMSAPRAEPARPARRGGSSKVAKPHLLENRGERQLVITVVPDSGSGELAGLAGRMDIRITEGQHFYELDYSLP